MSPDSAHTPATNGKKPLASPRLPIWTPSAPMPSAHEELVPEVPEKLLRVGDLARLTGKTVRAIHLYEELGLLRPHGRSKGRYRLFGPDALVRTRWITKLQELGLSLNDIRTVLREWEALGSATGAMALMREVYRRRLEDTRAQISKLRTLEHELAASLAYLETCDSCDPDVVVAECSVCRMHAAAAEPPELIAGLSAQRMKLDE